MTSALYVAVALSAAVLFVLSAIAVVPRPPELAAEALFKALLIQALGGDAPAAARVAWHPLGRLPERKIARPNAEATPGTPLVGEVELLRALAALPDAPARWAALRGEGRALLDPDAALPEDHRPARWLGNGATWRSVVAPGGLADAEARHGLGWVRVSGSPRAGVPDLGGAFTDAAEVAWCQALAGDDGARAAGAVVATLRAALAVPGGAALAAEVARVSRAALEAAIVGVVGAELAVRTADPARRWILLATGEGLPVALRALHADMALRDRIVAVVSVGGAALGDPSRADLAGEAAARDWMDAHFRHESLDVEVVRPVPYLSVGWLDPRVEPPGAAGLPLVHARFPEPGYVGSGTLFHPKEPEVVRGMDLGALDLDLPGEAVGRALRATAVIAVVAMGG
jgi:hypothetical protein